MSNKNGNQPVLCPHGILGIRKCKECKKEYQQKYLGRPGKKDRLRDRHKKWLERNPNYNRALTRRKLGIPEEGGIAPVGECALCHDNTVLVPDHNHATGAFRGWLCGRCNRDLGVYEKLRPIVPMLEDYLK